MLLADWDLTGVVLSTLVVCLAGSATSCSRSPVRDGEVDPDAPTICQVDADCRGLDACEIRKCSAGLCETTGRVTCRDDDPCTNDLCNPVDGTCSYPWVTADSDGDGYRAALPNKSPLASDSCGNDCNDASATVHPNAKEACDGIDNDCNGVVDEGFRYDGTGEPKTDAIWVSATATNEALPGALVFNGREFAMSTIERNERWQGVFHSIGPDGELRVEATPITSESSDGIAGPMVWTGAVFGTAWEDRRQKSYEIYFNRLDANGKKLHPDLRVTASDGFSVQPSLAYDGEGAGWMLAYSDDLRTDVFTIFTQRISDDAALIGTASQVTPTGLDARRPRLSKSSDGIGLFYYSVFDTQYFFQRLDAKLLPDGDPVALALDTPADASIRWNGDRYVLAWTPEIETVAKSVWAMTVDTSGRVISAPRTITSGANMARGPSIVALGDRFVLVWADDRYSPGSFELSMQTFNNELVPLTGQQQITKLGSDSIDPVGAVGGGSLSVLFRSRLYHDWQTFFVALQCWTAPSGG